MSPQTPRLLLPLLVLVGLGFFLGRSGEALAASATSLFKGSGSTVYFRSLDGQRHVFPNQATFNSWLFGTKPTITAVSDSALSQMPLGNNMLFRPGVRLVKITTNPKVYAVSRYGVLRWITTEAVARALYGASWSKSVTDLPDPFFANYQIGVPITSADDFDPDDEQTSVPTPQENLLSEHTTSDGWMTQDQKRRAMQITSVFENGDPQFHYDYVENINDGRGYTSGRVGFTTGTGDAYQVVQRYTDQVPNNQLAKYLPRLKELNNSEDDSVAGLEGYAQAWAQAAKDPLFRQAQDNEVDEVYYRPAMKQANTLGLHTAIGRAIIYDTIIQHGEGNTPDSLGALITRTNTAAHGTPATGVNELTWLQEFLDTRRADLAHAYNFDTREAWALSVDRVDALLALLNGGNLDLKGPVVMNTEPYQAVLE